MKKFLSLVLGFALLAGALVTVTSASRDAYHQYLMKQTLENRDMRRVTDRQGVSPRTVTSRTPRTYRRSMRSAQQNLRYPTTSKRYFYDKTPDHTRTDLDIRTATEAIRSTEKQYTGRAVLPKMLAGFSLPMETYENDYFSMQIPTGWEPAHVDGKFTIGQNNDFEVTVTREEDACSNQSFTMCAMAHSYNKSSEWIMYVQSRSQVMRRTQKTDKILGSFDRVNTLTESFIGTIDGEDERFFTRYFVEGIDGEAFVIEVRSSRAYASRAIAISKQMFDTFRLYPLERRAN